MTEAIPYSERKDVHFSISSVALGMSLLSIPFMYWGFTQEDHWKRVLCYANGLGILALSTQLSRTGVLLQRRNTAMSQMYDQLAPQLLWDNRQNLLPPSTEVVEEGGIGENPGIPSLEWSEFVSTIINKPELYPHLAIFAPTGFGKTLTAEVIGDLRAAHYARTSSEYRKLYISPIIDTDEFLGWEIVGRGFDKDKLNEFIQFLQYDLIKRYENMDDKNIPALIATMDEYRWTAKNATNVPDTVGNGLSMGRRRKVNYILIAQGKGVKTLKMEGEGDLREQFVEVLKGGFVEERISLLESEGRTPVGSTSYINKLLHTKPYDVCLVNDRLMLLPSLSLYRIAKKEQGMTYAQPPAFLLPDKPFNNPYSSKPSSSSSRR